MIEYVYYDDEKPISVKAYIDAVTENFNDEYHLVINHLSPRPWDTQIKLIREGHYSGIILDLRLDTQAQWEGDSIGKKAQYRAEELAQKIRVDATEGIIPDVPIVLWSTDQNLNNSGFSRDSTPKDLFDLKVVKTSISNKASEIRLKLIALAEGYRIIEQSYSESMIRLDKCLNLPVHVEEYIDPRIISYFSVDIKPPIHDVARYILDEIIRKPGILIDEHLLATRLGISIQESEKWAVFLDDILSFARYTGVFYKGWTNFFGDELYGWWRQNFQESNLKTLKASERVELINNRYAGYNLTPLSSSSDDPEGKYWYNCMITGKPISQKSSFLVSDPHKLPWQESLYLSKEAIRKRLDRTNGISIDQLDAQRLIEFKKSES